MSEKEIMPELTPKSSIGVYDKQRPWNHYREPAPALGVSRVRSARHVACLQWLPLVICLAVSVTPNAWGQPNKDKGQGAALNFTPMNWFGTNLPKQTLTFLRLPGISPDYRLGAGDVLKIDVIGSAFLGQTYKISNSGKISVPLLGTIQAEGLTAEELESEIGKQLKEQQLLKSPEVLVYIDSYEAKPIYVVGEVDYPGEYVMSQQLTLMDAIFLAGGLDFTASRYGYLHRRLSKDAASKLPVTGQPIGRKPVFNVLMEQNRPRDGFTGGPEIAGPGTEVIKVDLQPMKEGGVLTPNIPLRAGDVFVVPKRNVEFFYVVGDVLNAGGFEIPPGVSLLASQALSWAGGPAKTAKMSGGILVRYDENGKRQELKIDYAAILKGKQQDFGVRPNDILFIPGSGAKTLGYGLLGVIPGAVQSNVINAPAKR